MNRLRFPLPGLLAPLCFTPCARPATVRSLLLFVFFTASLGYGETPSVKITAREKSGGKIVKQVTTGADGNFSLGALAPGAYVLEFRPQKATEVKNRQFSIAVSGIKISGRQSVAGNSLAGGVALNVEVELPGRVTGQVVTGANTVEKKTKMVWIPAMLGSNMPGHWAEEGSAEQVTSKNRGTLSRQGIQNMQDGSVTAGRR